MLSEEQIKETKEYLLGELNAYREAQDIIVENEGSEAIRIIQDKTNKLLYHFCWHKDCPHCEKVPEAVSAFSLGDSEGYQRGVREATERIIGAVDVYYYRAKSGTEDNAAILRMEMNNLLDSLDSILSTPASSEGKE